MTGVLEQIEELVLADPRVVFVGSDLGAGQFDRLAREAPDRFFMEGIQEQHLIGMAAGLATEGFVPIVMTISTFLTRRCLEQIVVDVALHDLPVRLLGTGSGLAYAALGPTHIAVDDFAVLRAVPGMTVLAPGDTDEANALLRQAVDHPGPLYLRLPRGYERPTGATRPPVIGRAEPLHDGGRVLLVSAGGMTGTALEAHALLDARGIRAGVLHVHTVEPLDRAALCAAASTVDVVVTLEEHLRTGGLGSAVLEALHDAAPHDTALHDTAPHDTALHDTALHDTALHDMAPHDAARHPVPAVLRLGLPHAFVTGYGTREEQLARHGLTAEAIVEAIVRGRVPIG
jgi:transketolase